MNENNFKKQLLELIKAEEDRLKAVDMASDIEMIKAKIKDSCMNGNFRFIKIDRESLSETHQVYFKRIANYIFETLELDVELRDNFLFISVEV